MEELFINLEAVMAAVDYLREAASTVDVSSGPEFDVHYGRDTSIPAGVSAAFGAAFSASSTVAARSRRVATNVEFGAQATRLADYLETRG